MLNKRGVVDSASDVERASNRPANSTVDYQAEKKAIEGELKDLDLAGRVIRVVRPRQNQEMVYIRYPGSVKEKSSQPWRTFAQTVWAFLERSKNKAEPCATWRPKRITCN